MHGNYTDNAIQWHTYMEFSKVPLRDHSSWLLHQAVLQGLRQQLSLHSTQSPVSACCQQVFHNRPVLGKTTVSGYKSSQLQTIQEKYLHKTTFLCFFIMLCFKFLAMSCQFTQFIFQFSCSGLKSVTFNLCTKMQYLRSQQCLITTNINGNCTPSYTT